MDSAFLNIFYKVIFDNMIVYGHLTFIICHPLEANNWTFQIARKRHYWNRATYFMWRIRNYKGLFL